MQQKTKIYLSKSKSGDLTYIAYIRDILHKLDAEILEFAGGTYNTDALLKSDILLVVPPHRKEYIDDEDAYWVGKGQYEEINTFRKQNPCNSVYIVADTDFDTEEGQHSFLVEEFYGSEVFNKNWQIEYAAIKTDDCPEFITLFDLEFKQETPTLKTGYDTETQKAIIDRGLEVHEKMCLQPTLDPNAVNSTCTVRVRRRVSLACITLF